MSLKMRVSLTPEAEFKFSGDRDTAHKIIKDYRLRDTWHHQTTAYFDYTRRGQRQKARLGFAQWNMCLRIRKINDCATVPSNRFIDRYHALTLKVENGVVSSGGAQAGFLSRVELTVNGLDAHDPSPEVMQFLFREYQRDILSRTGGKGHRSPLDLRIQQAVGGMGGFDNLRLSVTSSGRRHDGVLMLGSSAVAICVDILEIRTFDGRKQVMVEVEFELIPPRGHAQSKARAVHAHGDIEKTNPEFVAFAHDIQDRFGLKVQKISKAQRCVDFLMEEPCIAAGNGSMGILWPQAVERRGVSLSRTDREAYKFLMHGTPR